ncbi:unnamed protein product [Ostreobium quekettii]|uniref:Tyrosine--tRNA ligase n=1 Tax=Ostreobium quekettii TaxID=121088 RepID=A0A8S1JBQ2_9CHLO|nr:unnamed protein product [Ostreobium quekettii]
MLWRAASREAALVAQSRVAAPGFRPSPGGLAALHNGWVQGRVNTTGRRDESQLHPNGLTTCIHCQASADVVDSVPTQAGTSTQGRIVSILRERGLVESITNEELESVAANEQLSVYCGFDPTADSLHLGNLLGFVVLSWFQRCGHQPIALIGGATGRVGDPSGKSAERPMMSEEQIQKNCEGIASLIKRILGRSTVGNGSALRILNNLDWFGGMQFLEFLRDVGKFARVGVMLAKDSVKTRLASEEGISFTEFTYQLLQGYDFFHLCRTEGVKVEIGGSDQWGNITAGTDLTRKLWKPEYGDAPVVFGLTFPLLLDSEGRKFGKSEGGAVWLSADKLSPYKFYQHLFATTDADVFRFLRMLTFLPLEEIAALEEAMKGTPESGYLPNTAQRRLAEEVTEFVHGKEGLLQAQRATMVR